MPDPTDSATLIRISNGSDLYDVRTIGTFSRLHANPPPGGVALSAELAIHLDGEIARDQFQIVGKFGVKAREATEPPKLFFFSASIHLVAYYRLRSGQTITDAELEQFAETAGMLHFWPYVRTFVQQSCGQLSIAPIVLPPFRANGSIKVRFGSNASEPTSAPNS